MSADSTPGPILLCWDGSPSAGSAIMHAAEILGAGRRAIVLFVHVPTEEHRGVLAGTSGPDAPIVGVADAEVALEQGERAARQAGFDASGLRIAASDRKTADVIVAVAEENDAALIVMGQRGRSGFKAALLGLGSVAQGVLGSYGGPVMLVGRDAGAPSPA